MFNTLPTRRVGLAALAVLALLPSAASAKPHAKASQVDDRTTVGAVNEISKEAWAAGEKLYGAKVTEDLALSAYWTPERMKAAEPVDNAPFLEEAYKRYEATDADRQRRPSSTRKRASSRPSRAPS